MKYVNILLIATLMYSCANKPTVEYPETRMDSVTDTYFGEVVADPYR